MARDGLISAAFGGLVALGLVACSGGGHGGSANSAMSVTTTTTAPTPTSASPAPTAPTYTLVSLQAGDAACYLTVTGSSSAEQSLPADFELCPGGTSDASRYVRSQITLERRPSPVMADSCAGDPNCTATKTVDLVVAVKPSATASTTGPGSATLMGQTDANPAHWAPSGYEKPQRIQQRIFGADPPTLVAGFPVTMNGCNTRQLRVKWRSVDSPVAAGITDYSDPTTPPPTVRRQQPPALQGTMTVGGCEQPAYRTYTQPGGANLANVVVEVTVYEPAA